jgi:hypothetical protein
MTHYSRLGDIEDISPRYLKQLKEYSLSDSDIKDIIGKTNIITYPELKGLNHIDEVFKRGKNGIETAIILYLTENEKTGHWIGLIKRGNTIEIYDPYGNKSNEIGEMLGGVMSYKQDPYLLKNMIKNAGYKLIENKKKVQPVSQNINTCGRHTAMRIMFGFLPLKEYNEKMNDIVKKNNISIDDLATALTHSIIEK